MNVKYDNYSEFVNYLKSIKDVKYKDFNKKLIDTKYEMLGIRLPILRSIGKDISKGDYLKFLSVVKNNYFEEVMIEGFVISHIKDEELFDKYFDSFILKIDNWSTCDSFVSSLKRLKKNKKYFKKFLKLTKSKKEYVKRVGIVGILFIYISDDNIDEIINMIKNIEVNTYYEKMALAWLICECFIKQRDKMISVMENNNIDDWTFNKSISKCIESYRVSDSDKIYLRKLKRKVK